jgi:tRNA splicing endonuclease
MTNAQIIFLESIKLMEQGIIESTDETVKVKRERDGVEVEEELGMPEPIHTYASWKSLGYQVRKGEKAIAQFPIWKMTASHKDKETDEEKDGFMMMKMSSFFKFSQVDKIEVKEEV